MIRRSRVTSGKRLVVHMVVYTVAFTILAPFIWMVISSLKSDTQAIGPVVSVVPGGSILEWKWSNYLEAARNLRLDRFYFNSIVVAAITAALAVTHSVLAGYAFAKRRFHGRRILFGVTIATMMMPMPAMFIIAYIITGRLGFVDNLQALIVPFLASGFGVYYMRYAIAAMPDSLIDAGRIDGMTDMDMLWTLVRPCVWPAISALGIYLFLASWNSFLWPLIVADSDQTKTIPVAIAELSVGRSISSWPVRIAACVILTAPSLIVFAVFHRALVRSATVNGLRLERPAPWC